MALETRRWRPRPVTLTPLIDVIFLLLLFFMLSSTFTRFAEVPLVNAGGGGGDGPPVFVQLRADAVALNGTAMPMDALLPAIGALGGDGGERIVLVTLSGEVTSQRLVDLLTVLRGAPDLAVSVLE